MSKLSLFEYNLWLNQKYYFIQSLSNFLVCVSHALLIMLDKSVAHMLSTVASVYGVFTYSLAFALEMWFIFSTDLLDYAVDAYETTSHFNSSPNNSTPFANTVGRPNEEHHLISLMSNPVFAFILAAVYFIIVVVSLLLMLGLIIRSMLCLLSWVITMALLFFPECGLVLHLTLSVWVSICLIFTLPCLPSRVYLRSFQLEANQSIIQPIIEVLMCLLFPYFFDFSCISTANRFSKWPNRTVLLRLASHHERIFHDLRPKSDLSMANRKANVKLCVKFERLSRISRHIHRRFCLEFKLWCIRFLLPSPSSCAPPSVSSLRCAKSKHF